MITTLDMLRRVPERVQTLAVAVAQDTEVLLAVEAARLDGADRGECLMKGQMEQDTWKMKSGSMGAKDHEFQEGGRESSAVENSKKWGHI